MHRGMRVFAEDGTDMGAVTRVYRVGQGRRRGAVQGVMTDRCMETFKLPDFFTIFRRRDRWESKFLRGTFHLRDDTLATPAQ